MAWAFGDFMDCYATSADMITNYWDSNVGTIGSIGLGTGRFAGSRAVNFSASTALVKSSAVNDGVHHFIIAFEQTAAITGSTLGMYLQLFDGATSQCSVVFRSDGAILLVNGGPAGTVQTTYTGAFPVVNTWYAFEIEVTISNTTGRMRVRKNGNPADDFDSGATMDTQNSANAYANKLQFGAQSNVSAQWTDDLYWRSDASSVAWMGDIRCYTRAPASDVSVQFSRTGIAGVTQSIGSSTSDNASNTIAYIVPYTAVGSGSIGSVTVVSGASAISGNIKAAIWADNGASAPGAVLVSLPGQAVVGVGNNVFTLSTPLAVTAGQKIWLGTIVDTTTGQWRTSGSSGAGVTSVTSYAAFPAANPVPTTNKGLLSSAITYVTAAGNFAVVNEPQQDATTSYVYDSVVGHADLYGIAAIASTPLTTYAVTTRAYAIKSDAGTRTMAVQLKSGASTVASPTVVLTPSNWQWAWRHDVTDPATGSAWTAAAVNLAQCGPVIIA